MSQGIIMALNKKTAVVLKPDGQFVKVRRQQHYEIGASITDLGTLRAVPRTRQRMLQWGAMTSALLIFLVGIWMVQPPPVVAYVSMDINPSIELGLDQKERVRTLRAVNEDTEAFIKGLDYKGKALEAVMTEIAQKLVEQHILTVEHPEVVIASVPMRALGVEWEAHVTQTMTRVLNEATEQVDTENKIHLDVTTVSLPAEIRVEAEEKGVSSGKMAFWLVTESQGHEVPIETLKKESLKSIAASRGGVKEVMSHYGVEKTNTIIEEDKQDSIKLDETKTDSKKPDDKTSMSNSDDKEKKINNNKTIDKIMDKNSNNQISEDKHSGDKKNDNSKSDVKKNSNNEDKSSNMSSNNKEIVDNRNKDNKVEVDSDDKTITGEDNKKKNNKNNKNNEPSKLDTDNNENKKDNNKDNKSDIQKEKWKQLLESSQD